MEGGQQTTDAHSEGAVPTAPTALQRWFPIGAWLPNYNWGRLAGADLIAAVSVAALVIPESMGYASVAGVPVQIGLYAAPLALIAPLLLSHPSTADEEFKVQWSATLEGMFRVLQDQEASLA